MATALGKRDAATAMDFVDALRELQRACGVADLKMSDYRHSAGRHGPIRCQRPRDHGRTVPGSIRRR